MGLALLPVTLLALIVPVKNFEDPSMKWVAHDLEELQRLHNHSYTIIFGTDENFYIYPAPDLPGEVKKELFEKLQLEFDWIPHKEVRIDPARIT